MKQLLITSLVVFAIVGLLYYMHVVEVETDRRDAWRKEHLKKAKAFTDSMVIMSAARYDRIVWIGIVGDIDATGRECRLTIHSDSTMEIRGDTMQVIIMLLHRIEDSYKKNLWQSERNPKKKLNQ